MKAVVYHEYGLPDVLSLEQVTKPVIQGHEVLVSIHASCINSWDWELLRGVPFVNRLMAGIFRPKRIKILGCDIAGTISAVGRKVKRLHVGDEVFGDMSGCGWGGFAEYVAVREDALHLKPSCLTFEQAAALPQAALLALQGLERGEIQPGKQVLVNGAGGGSGTFALQLAKDIGAEVTGVDSAEKLEIMRLSGADRVIDYTQEDFTNNEQKYDLILDNAACHRLSDYKRVLNPGGIHVMVGGSSFSILQAMLASVSGSKKFRLLLHKANIGIERMIALIEAGRVVPVIDRCYSLEEVAEAMRYFGDGHAKGKIVIKVR